MTSAIELRSSAAAAAAAGTEDRVGATRSQVQLMLHFALVFR